MKRFSSILLIIAMLALTLTGCTKESFVRGQWTNDVYSNTFAKLNFTLPEGWKASTDEEITAQMEISTELLSDESKFMEELLKKQTITDMMCVNVATNSNIIVMFENLAVSGNTKMTAEEYADIVKDQLAAQKVSGLEYIIEDGTSDKTVSGNTYKVLTATVGSNISQYYLLRKEDKYITAIIITLASPNETLDDILKSFQ